MGTINRSKAKSRSELSLREVLHALADPVRLEIVRQLDEAGEKTCGMFEIDMPNPLSRTTFGSCARVALSFQRRRGRSL